ncbi:MAG: AAC(3) family N-acetyltransferase [Tannerella sp.]|jgi:aminoglycoside 3-N-acetyltransferase|nr:AAC(3) family N-acetyltransferase [Tannerella sp.]
MGIKKIISNMLPEDVAKTVRYKYRIFRQRLHRPMSEEYFKTLLVQKLGIKEGDTLFVHSSTDFLNIDFSPFRILKILRETVGKEGTLIFPAWHFSQRAEDYLQDENNIFDVKHSPAVLGLLPQLSRRQPDAQRSIHPINSILAVGANAKEIVSGHEQSIYPCGESSPYYKMLKYNAKIIGIGVNVNFLSFFHCTEDVMREAFPLQTRTDRTFFGKVRLATGEIIQVETLAAHQNIQKRKDVPAFLKKHVSKDIYSAYRIRGSDFFVADANTLFHRLIELAKQGIILYNY